MASEVLQHHAVWVHDLEKKIIGACMKGLQKDHTAAVVTTAVLGSSLLHEDPFCNLPHTPAVAALAAGHLQLKQQLSNNCH